MTNPYTMELTLQIVFSGSAIVCAVVLPLYCLLRRGSTLANLALFASLLSAAAIEVFDLLALVQPESIMLWKRFAIFAEAFLPFMCLLFTLTYARDSIGIRSISLLQRWYLGLSVLFIAVPLFLPMSELFISPDFAQERILFLGNWGYAFYLCLMVYLIISLINLEATFASASRAVRWSIKFDIVGVGSILAMLVFYYSQSLLYRTINMNLMPVRTVALIVATILISYSQWRQNAPSKIHVSKNLVYKSIVLFAVGIYLVGLGLVGEGMRYFSESFQRSILIACAFAAGLGFLVILLSERVKRRVKVMLIKNFYQDKYDYKTQWVQFTDRLASSRTSDELLTGILACYCETFGMGGGGLYLGNDLDNFTLAAQLDIEIPPRFSRYDPLIAFMQKSRWVINLRENPPEPGMAKNEFVQVAHLSVVIPLFLNDVMDGFIVLGRPLIEKETYNFEDYDLMKTFARQTSLALLNSRLSGELAEAKEMEVLGKISAFLVHDLKNLVYTLSLIVGNARDYITEPEFQHDMLDSLGNTVTKMNTLITKLKYLPEKSSLQKEPVDLLPLIQETATLITGAEVCVTGSSTVTLVDRTEMQKVVLNLLLNAVEATQGKGGVTVEVGYDGDAYFKILDEGCGISEDFLRRHLFSPFKTTKKNGLGIGLYQCKHVVEAHDGRIDVTSDLGKGTVFTIRLPASHAITTYN